MWGWARAGIPAIVLATGEEQHWQSDVTDSMGIGPSLTGYRHVGLRCAADHMEVDVELEDDFDGVLYTRGAFYSQKEPCFLDAKGGRNFTLRLPFAQCNTRNVRPPGPDPQRPENNATEPTTSTKTKTK